MAAVNVTSTFSGTSSFRGTVFNEDIRVVNGEIGSLLALHIVNTGTNAGKIYVTQNGFVSLVGNYLTLQALARLLNNVLSGA